jgi:hypothetical protein
MFCVLKLGDFITSKHLEAHKRGGSIFLAGSLDKDDYNGWRAKALSILEELRFEGLVYIPEKGSTRKFQEEEDIHEWLNEAISRSTVIFAWCDDSLAWVNNVKKKGVYLQCHCLNFLSRRSKLDG